MDQDTQLPFHVGDHVCYVGGKMRKAPVGAGRCSVVLVPGMTGVIIASPGALAGDGAATLHSWRCQAQFPNGFQLDITNANFVDFRLGRGRFHVGEGEELPAASIAQE